MQVENILKIEIVSVFLAHCIKEKTMVKYKKETDLSVETFVSAQTTFFFPSLASPENFWEVEKACS